MAKNKSKRKPIIKVKGFNLNKKTGHVSFAFWQKDRNVMSIGFTHNEKEKYGSKTKLNHNINPNDKRACYAKNKIEKQKDLDYKKKSEYSNFRIHKEDQSKINLIIKNGTKKDRK